METSIPEFGAAVIRTTSQSVGYFKPRIIEQDWRQLFPPWEHGELRLSTARISSINLPEYQQLPATRHSGNRGYRCENSNCGSVGPLKRPASDRQPKQLADELQLGE